jgi:hypothetical protein
MASIIKVDNVQNTPGTNVVSKCGTDITLGASGDTVALACGASQTGFGRTGTVDWVTTPKVTGDSPITAATGSGYFLNTTAGTITFNLPAGAAGSIVSLADYAGTWQTNNVTVNANGSEKIGSVNAPVTLNTEGQSITLVYVDSTQGWINTMDSTSNVRASSFMVASVSGACNTLATAPCCANTKIATFLGPGTFTVCSAASAPSDNTVSYLVVAGGGAGGSGGGAGGGAGGFREIKSPSATGYTASPLDGYATPANRIEVTGTAYPITVGAGGARSPAPGPVGALGGSGAASVFSTTTSAGGGGGGGKDGTAPTAITDGADGGSGGGGSYDTPGVGNLAPGGAGNTPPVTPSQGFAGGQGRHNGPTHGLSGGGGGAGAVGPGELPGGPPYGTSDGGAGVTTSISATPTGYAGGGGGEGPCGAANPVGGGGNKRVAGTINRGGGGGGGDTPAPTGAGAGGSGIVIIRYKFQ